MPQPPSRSRSITVFSLAVAVASTLWFVARDAKPVLPLDSLKALLKPSALFNVVPAALAAPHGGKRLPEVDFTGQLAKMGSQTMGHIWVRLSWDDTKPRLILDGQRHPLVTPALQDGELAFGVNDLFGRKGVWQFRLRVDGNTLSGPVTAPDDPLMGGYMVVSQTVTRKVIPPPPVVRPHRS